MHPLSVDLAAIALIFLIYVAIIAHLFRLEVFTARQRLVAGLAMILCAALFSFAVSQTMAEFNVSVGTSQLTSSFELLRDSLSIAQTVLNFSFGAVGAGLVVNALISKPLA